MRTHLRAIARFSARWALVCLAGLAPPLAGSADGDVALFRAAASASDAQPVPLCDEELGLLRGRQLPSAAERSAHRKRVVLWDEARTATPNPLDPHNEVLIRGGAAGVWNLKPGITSH